jgi:outer membrane protein W
MKKTMTIAAALLLSIAAGTTAKAQKSKKISLGIVGSAGHSWTSNTSGNLDFKFAPALGIGMVYSHNEHWGYASELLVAHEGYKNDYPRNNGVVQKLTVNPVYLRMPMHLVYFFGKYGDRVRPKIYAGPSLALKVDEQQWSRNGFDNETRMYNTDMFRRFDIGINAGVGANFRLARKTWLNADLGYTHGLMDAMVDDVNNNHNGNRNIRGTVGVMWGL